MCGCHNGSHHILGALVVRISNGDTDSGRTVAVQRRTNRLNGDGAGQPLAVTGTRNPARIVNSKGAHGVITDFDSKNHGAAGGIVSPVQSTWT